MLARATAGVLSRLALFPGTLVLDRGRPPIFQIEVRDSWTGYLVPARDGSGLLPDWESSWDVAAAVTWKFKLTFCPGNYICSFQIGIWLMWELSEFWYRGSTQDFESDLSSIVIWLGELFWKKCLFAEYFQKQHVHVFGTSKISDFWQNTRRNVQIAISTISTHPKFKFSGNPNIN